MSTTQQPTWNQQVPATYRTDPLENEIQHVGGWNQTGEYQQQNWSQQSSHPEHRMPSALQNEIHHAGGHQPSQNWAQSGEPTSNLQHGGGFVHQQPHGDAGYHQGDLKDQSDQNQHQKHRADAGYYYGQEQVHQTGNQTGDGYHSTENMHGSQVNQSQSYGHQQHDGDVQQTDNQYHHADQQTQAKEDDKKQEPSGLGGRFRKSSKPDKVKKMSDGEKADTEARNKANAAAERLKVQEADRLYELHKTQAMNANLPATERLRAGVAMAEDVLRGGYHRAAEELHKRT